MNFTTAPMSLEVGSFGRKEPKKQDSPSPSSPDMSAVAFSTAVAFALKVAKVEGLSSEAVVNQKMDLREEKAGYGSITKDS